MDFVSEEGTPEEILKAISDVARARNDEDRTRGGNHARRALQGAFARRQPRVRHGLQNPQRDWMLAHAFPETHAKQVKLAVLARESFAPFHKKMLTGNACQHKKSYVILSKRKQC